MKIVAGRAGCGKSRFVYSQIGEEIEKDSGERLVLLVPDLMTYDIEVELIEALNLKGIMSLEVLSFKRLGHRILDEIAFPEGVEEIDEMGKVMILKEVFEENKESFKLFKDSKADIGLIREFSRLIKELKHNLVEVEALYKSIESIEDDFLKSKLWDINLIYEKYLEKTRERFFDEEDVYSFIIGNIKNSAYVKSSRIWIDGFESFNQQRISMIKKLEENAREVTLTLNADREYIEDLEAFGDWEAFRIIHDTYNSIEGFIGDMDFVEIPERKIANEEIRIVEENLFAMDLQSYEGDINNIQIFQGRDPYCEIEEAAKRIICLVRDEGYRWKDIKIGASDLDNYMVDIKKVFDRFEIPHFADTKRDIGSNPLCKYILSLLDILIWNFRYDDVFQFLKTGFSDLKDNEIDIIENYALEYGIEGHKWFWNIPSSELEEIRVKFVAGFEKEIEEFKNLETIGAITGFILDFMEKREIPSQVNAHIEKLKIEDKHEEVSEYSQVWNSLMEIFEEILAMGEDRYIKSREYKDLLEKAFEEREISIIPPTIDRVEVGDIERIAVTKARAVFILGANEASLESNKLSGLLTDEDIEILGEKDIEILNCSDFLYFKKKHMLYKIFTSPREKLYVSYALGSRDGKSLQPSMYIDILKTIFPSLDEAGEIVEGDHILDNGATYDELVVNINSYLYGGEVDSLWKSVFQWYEENESETYDLIVDSFNYENNLDRLGREDIDKIFDSEISMTVSKLESYAQCPFQYLVGNVLRPEPRQVQKIEFYDIGNIYHGVLEDFIDRIICENIDIKSLKDEDVGILIETSTEKVFADYSKRVPALEANERNIYLKNKLARVLRRSASVIIKQLQRGDFRPSYTELEIGKIDRNVDGGKEHIDSLELATEDHRIKLRGIIDRIDSYENQDGDVYINIIDYKSSDSDIDPTDTYEGFQVQLLVYLKAILENGEKLFGKKPKAAGAYYYRVDDPLIQEKDQNIDDEILKDLKLKGLVLEDIDIIKKVDKEIDGTSDIIPVRINKNGSIGKVSRSYTEGEIDQILDYVYRKISSLSEDILSGDFPISPYRKRNGMTPCKYCEYRSICQFDEAVGNEYRQVSNISRSSFLDKISEKAVD